MNPNTIQKLIDMLGACIDNISFCRTDLEYIEQDFKIRYPDYQSPQLNKFWVDCLDGFMEKLELYRRQCFISTVCRNFESIISVMWYAIKNYVDENQNSIKITSVTNLQSYCEKYENYKAMKRLKKTLVCFGKIFDEDFAIDFNCSEWQKIVRTVKVRNRITHPKHRNDYIVTDAEINVANEAYEWFFYKFGEALKKEKLQTHS
jgi:hypothetical protein